MAQKVLISDKLAPEGVKFLVDLRADTLRFLRQAPELEIIDEELKRYKTDLADQMRIVEDDTFLRVERLLVGKTANKGPKKLVKGAKITKAYLQDLDRYHWFDVRVANDKASRVMEQLKEGLAAKRVEFDRAFVRSAINTLGAFTGLPSAQINRTIDGVQAILEGEVEGVGAVVAPLTGVKK